MKRTMLLSLGGLVIVGLVAAGCCGPPPKMAPAPKPAPKPMALCPGPGMTGVSATLPAGNPDCDVVRVVKCAPAEVIAGQPFDYTVRVTNMTRATLEDVVVTDTVTSNVKVAGSSPQATMTGETLKWAVGQMKAGETKTFVVRASAAGPGVLRNCVHVTFKMPEVCLTIRAVRPALKIEKTGPEIVTVCDPVTYRVVVTNTGSGPAHNVVVTDTMDEGMTTLDGKNAASFSLGTLAAGQSREIAVQAKAAKAGKFTNKAAVTAEGGVTAAAEASTTFVQPALAVTKTGPAMRYVGRSATYDITVKNTGTVDARNTVLTDSIPAGTTLVSAEPKGQVSGATIVWAMGTIPSGESRSAKVTLTLNEIGTVRNSAVARAHCAEASAQATTKVEGIPAILLECVDNPDPVEVGTNTTYTITVTNQGSTPDTGIKIVATVPDEEEFVSADGPTKFEAKGKTVTFAPLASLAAKARATYLVVVKGAKPGDARFKVVLTSDWLKTPVEETESTHVYSGR